MSVLSQCPPVPAPSVAASGLLDSWIEGCAAAADGLGRCWAAALEHGPAAFDLPRWIATAQATSSTVESESTPLLVTVPAGD